MKAFAFILSLATICLALQFAGPAQADGNHAAALAAHEVASAGQGAKFVGGKFVGVGRLGVSRQFRPVFNRGRGIGFAGGRFFGGGLGGVGFGLGGYGVQQQQFAVQQQFLPVQQVQVMQSYAVQQQAFAVQGCAPVGVGAGVYGSAGLSFGIGHGGARFAGGRFIR